VSVNESIDGLITDAGLTVQRYGIGAIVDGIYTPAAPTTILIDAVIQPAYNLNRVVGGADLHANVDGQSSTDIEQVHTRTELFERTPEHDPDVIVGYKGANWTVMRVEKWDLDGEIHYHAVIAKQTKGAS
jgi:hypothetical protein